LAATRNLPEPERRDDVADGQLQHVEEALVAVAIAAGQPVHCSPSPPPAVVLGVRVADKVLAAA
jgi:hypothetical protein